MDTTVAGISPCAGRPRPLIDGRLAVVRVDLLASESTQAQKTYALRIFFY